MGQMGGMDMEHGHSLMLHAKLSFETGRAETFGADRDYQGVALMLGARRDRFELMLHVPAYRVQLGANTGSGLGDVHLMGRYALWKRGMNELGLSAGVMPPFGDDEDGVGMGHWMAMGGAFARGSRGRFDGELTLGYGGALGGEGHAAHGVLLWPGVAPMNGQEIRSTARVGVDLASGVGASVSGLAAVPVGDGLFMALIGGELSYSMGHYTLAVGARHGLASHTARLVLSTSVMAMF
jgi:hypothetical protein